MISRHKVIDLDEAATGVVLSRDVLDGKRGVLLPRGATLTEALLRSLQRRGVQTISVLDDAVSDEQLQAERERVQQRLERQFRAAGTARGGQALLAALTQYRLEALQ